MTVPMTVAGHKKLQEELSNLKKFERPKAIEAIAIARGHGDLSENAEYDAAKEHQGFIEGRINELENKLSIANVIDPTKLSGDRIVFGATVTIFDIDKEQEATYMIVGEDETNLKEGRISVTSPVARALIGKHVDDEVTVITPAGERGYEIVDVNYI